MHVEKHFVGHFQDYFLTHRLNYLPSRVRIYSIESGVRSHSSRPNQSSGLSTWELSTLLHTHLSGLAEHDAGIEHEGTFAFFGHQ